MNFYASPNYDPDEAKGRIPSASWILVLIISEGYDIQAYIIFGLEEWLF